MSATLKSMSQEALRDLISSTEETLGELKEELERRESAAQRREVDRLDDHIKGAELSFRHFREFIAYLLEDLRADDKKNS